MRHRGAPAAADALARRDPRHRRAGLAGGLRAVPPDLAARHPAARGPRRRRGRHRAARRRADPGERLGVARSCRAASRTTPRRCSTSSPPPARCSGRATARFPVATAGSPCIPPSRRPSPWPSRRCPRARRRQPRSPAAGVARPRRRLLRRAAPAADRRRERAVGHRGAVESHLERARHERHLRPGAHAHRRRFAGASHHPAHAPGPAVPRRGGADGRGIRPAAAAGRRRTLVAAADARAGPDAARDGGREPAARPLRRRDARLGAVRGAARRLRPGVSGARRVRRGRPLPPRLRHREARRGPVRGIHHRRPAAGVRGPPRPGAAHGRHPGRDRSREPVRRRARLARARGRRPPAGPQGRRTRRARRRRARAVPRARRQVRARVRRRRAARRRGRPRSRRDRTRPAPRHPHDRAGQRRVRLRHGGRARAARCRFRRVDARTHAAAGDRRRRAASRRVPEGDTVHRLARRLDEVLAGHEVTRFELRVPQAATADLRGEPIHSVAARGKHLLHRIGPWTLHSHLKMEGVVGHLPPGRTVAQAGVQGARDRRHGRHRDGRLRPRRDRARPHGRRGAARRPPRPRSARRRLGPRRRRRGVSPPTRDPCTSPCRISATSPGSATSTPTRSSSCAASFPPLRRTRRMPRPSSISAPA